MKYHLPVLATELINLLDPKAGQIFLDVTLGHGGHSIEILKKGGIVYGLDADPNNLKTASDRIKDLNLSKNFHPISGNFSRLLSIWKKEINIPLDGLIADLGLSVNQQSGSGRGFSFNDPDSLDMRLNPKTQKLTAENIVNTWDKTKLYQLFAKYSQEKLSKPLSFEIVKHRQIQPIKSAQALSQIIYNYYQKKHYSTYHHPATKIFLALRIAVNHEFDNLKKLLLASQKIVAPGGNIGIISFHSGEDRLVKTFVQKNNYDSQKILPGYFEIKKNPLSRSAILRFYKIK